MEENGHYEDLSAPLDLSSIKRFCIPVTVNEMEPGPDGKEREVPREFRMMDATDDVAVRYRNIQARSFKMQDGKISAVEGGNNAEPFLVANCLFEKDKSGKWEINVSEARVRSWPYAIVSKLYERARKISGLSDRTDPEFIHRRMKADAASLARTRSETQLQQIADEIAKFIVDIKDKPVPLELTEEEDLGKKSRRKTPTTSG